MDIDDIDYPAIPHVISYIIESFIHCILLTYDLNESTPIFSYRHAYMINTTRLLLWCLKLTDTHNIYLFDEDNDHIK